MQGSPDESRDDLVIEQTFTLRNKRGFHARAATRFVQLISGYEVKVEVAKDGQTQDGRSIVGMLMLLANKGSAITVRCEGQEAQAAMSAVAHLIEDGFGEET